MNKFAKIGVTLALVAAASTASAQMYGEVGYTVGNIDIAGAGDANIGMLGATIGYELHKNVAIEAMFAGGIKDGSIRGVNVEATHSYGVFVKPKFAVADNFEVFAKLGWVESKITVSAGGLSASDSGNDFAYGVGAQYGVNKNVYLTGSYNMFYNKNDIKADGWTVGVGYKF